MSEQPGSGFTEAPDGATLPTKEPFDMGAALEKGSALLNKSSALVDNLQGSVTVFHAPAGEPGTGFPRAHRVLPQTLRATRECGEFEIKAQK